MHRIDTTDQPADLQVAQVIRAVGDYALALRASRCAFRAYAAACTARDDEAARTLDEARNLASVEAHEAHARLVALLEANA